MSGLVVLALLMTAFLIVVAPRQVADSAQQGPGLEVRHPFRLTTHDGRSFTEQHLKDKPHAVFLGFTNCPDICPTTLFDLSQQLKALGDDANKLRVLFVAVDVERDTPEQVTQYLQAFDPRIVGLTGTKAEMDTAASALRVFYQKVPNKEGEGYMVNHTASTLLFDSQGRFAGTLDQHEPAQNRLEKLKRLIRA